MKRLLDFATANRMGPVAEAGACIACLGLCLPGIAGSSTSVDICQEPAEEPHLTIAYFNQESSSFEAAPGETNLENYNTDVQFRPNDKWGFGAGHRSTILNANQIALQTNGYLHTFYFPIHRLRQSDQRGFRISIAPALSASSNVVTDPDEFSRDAVQLLAAVIWNRRQSDRLNLYYGVCGDHRFGKYQIYPVFNFSWLLNSGWIIDAGFPTSQVRRQLSKELSTSMRITPIGNEWYAKDKSLNKGSQLVYEAYILEWALSWRTQERFNLTASLGREFDGRYEMALRDESRVRLSGDSATRVGVTLAWHF